MTVLLGGSAGPVGWSVQFVAAPPDAVLSALLDVHARTDPQVAGPFAFDELTARLPPFEAPWTREIVMPCGDRWTAYLNNAPDGGDSTAVCPAVARAEGWRCVVATSTPRYGPGHQAVQFEVSGPDGEEPLGHVRTLLAGQGREPRAVARGPRVRRGRVPGRSGQRKHTVRTAMPPTLTS